MTTEEAGLFAILLQKALVHSRGRIRDAAGVLHQAMVSHEGGMPTWAFFAGLALGPDKVDVCTAGTLRVVLVEGGSVTQSTRDHILREDPQPGVEYPAEHETVVTRALGIGSRAEPESVQWPMRTGAQLAILSDEWRLHEQPARAEKAMRRFSRTLHVPTNCRDGFICVLDV
jgi:serine/threonine protein phosphatase PrpC